MNEKVKTARLSIFSNIFLILIKILAGVLSGSVSMISEAIHSSIDLIASIVAFFAVKIASKPPDTEHPYGHGKFENISGVIEAILIFIAALWIIYEAIHRLVNPRDIQFIQYGIIVMIISVFVNYFVSKKLYITAKKYDSIALEADALHLRTDIYTSLGVAIGFTLIYFTGNIWLDSVIAILVAILIIYQSIKLLKEAFSPLVDTQLPKDEMILINEILKNKLKDSKNINFKNLRTRKSGSQKYLDFIMCFPDGTTVKKAHDLCDSIEEHLQSHFSLLDITIHIEPNSNTEKGENN